MRPREIGRDLRAAALSAVTPPLMRLGSVMTPGTFAMGVLLIMEA